MKHTQIPTLPISDADRRSRTVRAEAPRYIQVVIEKTRAVPFVRSLEELEPDEIQPLSGGNDAATYMILHKGMGAIIKLGNHGIAAEAEALQAWATKSVQVPKVYGTGLVPGTSGSPAVAYIVEEAVVDVHGRLAETGENFLKHSPEKARHVGLLMGQELAKAHGCVSSRSFGDYADTDGNTAPYTSWNTYLVDYFMTQAEYLRKHRVATAHIEAAIRYIKACSFVTEGRYLHGDFSIRNTAIQPFKDKVLLFDPNPVIGDPSWDLAVLYNNYEFSKRQAAYDDRYAEICRRDKQLLIGFKQGYGRQIDERNLLSAQLVQGMLHANYHELKAAEGRGDKLALRARREAVLDMVRRISQEVQV